MGLQLQVTDWALLQEVLGYTLDTQKAAISMPPRNIRELQELLEEWPRGEAHVDGTGSSRVGRKTAPRGVRDQAREIGRAAASAAEQATSEWAGETGEEGGE